MEENSWIKIEPLKTKYEDWLSFYRSKITCFMTVDELRAGIEDLHVVGRQCPELLLIHAMNKIEELEEEIAKLK